MIVVFVILWIVCSLALWFIYHRLFAVLYFNLFNGCLKEIVTAGVLGAVFAWLIMRFWYISIIIVILFIVALVKRNH